MSKNKHIGANLNISSAIARFRERIERERRDIEAETGRVWFDSKAQAMAGAHDRGRGRGGYLSWNWMRRFGRGGIHTSRAGVQYA